MIELGRQGGIAHQARRPARRQRRRRAARLDAPEQRREAGGRAQGREPRRLAPQAHAQAAQGLGSASGSWAASSRRGSRPRPSISWNSTPRVAPVTLRIGRGLRQRLEPPGDMALEPERQPPAQAARARPLPADRSARDRRGGWSRLSPAIEPRHRRALPAEHAGRREREALVAGGFQPGETGRESRGSAPGGRRSAAGAGLRPRRSRRE